jgi:hypothetical protein
MHAPEVLSNFSRSYYKVLANPHLEIRGPTPRTSVTSCRELRADLTNCHGRAKSFLIIRLKWITFQQLI